MAPFFSVIIPTYNRAALIGKAIESVLQQTFKNWELLIIDDGSTDNTKQIVAQSNDPRIKYIYQQNAERCAARNNGIQHSSAPYITFLDSDDYYLGNRLQLLHNVIEAQNFPEAFFYTGLQLQDMDSGKTEDKDVAVISADKYDNIALSMIHSQQVCAHRKVFDSNLYNVNLSIGEDMELWLRIADKYTMQPIAGQCTVVVVEHSNRSISLKNANPLIKQEDTYQVVFSNGHPGTKISPAVKTIIYCNFYFSFARYYIYKAKRVKAVYWLLKSIAAMPSHPQTRYKLNLIRHILINPAIAAQLLHS